MKRFIVPVAYYGHGRVCMHEGVEFTDGRVVLSAWRDDEAVLGFASFAKMMTYLKIAGVPQPQWIDGADGEITNDHLRELFKIRRFHTMRDEDATGVSGIGKVAEGCVFSNGQVALAWVTQYRSLAWYSSLSELDAIHGHGGKTRLVYEDAAC